MRPVPYSSPHSAHQVPLRGAQPVPAPHFHASLLQRSEKFSAQLFPNQPLPYSLPLPPGGGVPNLANFQTVLQNSDPRWRSFIALLRISDKDIRPERTSRGGTLQHSFTLSHSRFEQPIQNQQHPHSLFRNDRGGGTRAIRSGRNALWRRQVALYAFSPPACPDSIGATRHFARIARAATMRAS